jgi:dTDP-4-dehydrorhamnose reductase
MAIVLDNHEERRQTGMKVLVTGSDGFLGSVFCWLARESGDQVLGTGRNPRFVLQGCQSEKLDITDRAACLRVTKAFAPDAIVHCARNVVGLGLCEKERETSFKINATGTLNMVKAAESVGAPFGYISTDWIFDGKKPVGEKYKEDDDVCPLNYYGVTKWAGEQIVEKSKLKWLILRPANIYGVHAFFLEPSSSHDATVMDRTSWIHKMIVKLQQGEEIWLPDTLYQSPVLANQLAEVTLRLLKEGKTGIFNVAGGEVSTRYQFARTAAEVFGLNSKLIAKGTLEELEANWGIPPELSGKIMPINAGLDVQKVEKTLGIKMHSYSDGLAKVRDYLRKRTSQT